MISVQEEMEWTIAAYGERYGVKDTDLPVSFRFEQHAPLQIESEDLERCLRHLNPWKATPRETAPAVLVKACAHSLSQTTVAQLNHRWKQGEAYVPERWSDADVALLVKAHGRSTSPLDLRPIGVQDSLGKAVMSTTILRAKKAIHSLVSRFPQCAYIKGRSTGTALRQVFSHCRDVREQCSQARLTIRQKFEGQSATECQGGVQASLDRSAAFDLVQWESIKEALDLAGVALEVQDVLMSWLTQVRYLFRHKHLQGQLRPRKGLRQGCTASPILWSAFTALLCTTIEHRLQLHWTRTHLSLYADDSHLRWTFTSYRGFEDAMAEMRTVVACFRRFNLRINMEKTKVLLKMAGTLKHRFKKEYIRRHDDQRRLLLNARDPSSWLTLVPHTEYLGLIISYGPYEQLSLRHRLQKAHGRRWALASVLHSNKVKIPYKFNIWRSCVDSTLRYGLVHCGLNGDQVAEMQKAVMKHTRAIVNNQAFLTGDTHETIIDRYHLPRVLMDLGDDLRQAREAQDRLPDWMYSDTWQAHLETQLALPAHRAEHESGTTDAYTWACPYCECMFPSSAALKHHARRVHDVDRCIPIFNKAAHSVGGLPTCRFCKKEFSRWQTLAGHITSNSCPSFDPNSSASPEAQQDHHNEPAPCEGSGETVDHPLPLSRVPEVQQAAKRGINAFIPLKHVTSRLQQYCALCGQWVASHRCMKRHYQYSHQQLLTDLGTSIQQLIDRTAAACPTCHYCHVRCKDWRSHVRKCTTAWQCAILHLAQDGRRRTGPILRHSAAGSKPADTEPSGGSDIQQATTTTSDGLPPRIPTARKPAVPGPRLSDYFGQACSRAGGGDKGVKAGPLPHILPTTRRPQHLAPLISNGKSLPGQATEQSYLGAGYQLIAFINHHGMHPQAGPLLYCIRTNVGNAMTIGRLNISLTFQTVPSRNKHLFCSIADLMSDQTDL